MKKPKTAALYYDTPHHFKTAIAQLRLLAQGTDAVECCKWGMPVYTIANKNVFGICRFKDFFGVWFFQGVFLKDPKKVLRNAQEGKTKAMRHWNFSSEEAIDPKGVLAYMQEAIANQKAGKTLQPTPTSKQHQIPLLLQQALDQKPDLAKAFNAFTPYKQKEFSEFIADAKRESTKVKRLAKILPMIAKGIGLNDAYR